MNSIHVLGVRIDDVSLQEALQRAELFVQEPRVHQIATINPEFIVAARKDPEFARVLAECDLNLPDGANLVSAAERLGTPLRERVAGTDFILYFSGVAAVCGWSVFVLGGRNGVGRQAAARLQSRYRHLKVAGIFEGSPAIGEEAEIRARINGSGAEILYVAYGAPAQDLWIARNKSELRSVRVAVGVGGAFDFLAKRARRAPKWVQQRRLEWLWRLMLQPRRARRQWSLVEFTWWIWQEQRRRRMGKREAESNLIVSGKH